MNEMTSVIYILVFLVLLGLAFIPAKLASDKGYSFGLFYLFGVLCWLPAVIVAAVISEKKVGADAKYHVAIRKQKNGDAWREYWTCPECGRSWYVKGLATSARCGNEECRCPVIIDRSLDSSNEAQ